MSVDVRPDETYRQLKERVQKESDVVLDISQIFYEGKKVDEDHNVYESFFGGKYFIQNISFYNTFYIWTKVADFNSLFASNIWKSYPSFMCSERMLHYN